MIHWLIFSSLCVTQTDEMVDIRREAIELPISVPENRPYNCHLCDIVVMCDGSVFIADFVNNCVRYLSAEYEFKYEMALPDFPWGVCEIDQSEFAVTVPRAGRVMFIQIADEGLEFLREFETENFTTDCRAICYMDGLLFLSFGSPPNACVKTTTLYGDILNIIRSDSEGNKLFISPFHMAVKRNGDDSSFRFASGSRMVEEHRVECVQTERLEDSPHLQQLSKANGTDNATVAKHRIEEAGHIIYVSDELKRQIIVVNSAGAVLVIHDMPDRTFGICWDRSGDLLFSLALVREVYKLHGDEMTCIMSRNQLDLLPETLAYNYRRNDLIIGFSKIIKAYNMD